MKRNGMPPLLTSFLLAVLVVSGVAIVWLNAVAAFPYGLR